MARRALVLGAVASVVLQCCAPAATENPEPPRQAEPASPTRSASRTGTTASVDNVEIAYSVHRIGDPNLVLLHGWMCDQSYWQNQVPVLAEGFGVTTVDLAGHGASGLGREHWTIASFGEDVKAVVEHLGLDRVIVVGHSMGGRVALETARLLPGVVIGVIGVDSLHTAEALRDPKEFEPWLSGFDSDFATSCDGFVRPMFGEAADPTVVDRIADDMCAGPASIGAALLRDYTTYNVAAAMQAAHVPVRTINAEKWPTTVENNRTYCDFGATFLRGHGHFLMQEAPDELNTALVDTVLALVTGSGEEEAPS